MVAMRLMGLSADIDTLVEQLQGVLDIVEMSGNYPNREGSQLVRRYLQIAVSADPPRPTRPKRKKAASQV